MPKSENDRMIKVKFAHGESGWAELLAPNLARIRNIPFSGDLNIDDVVELKKDPEGWHKVSKVVSSTFPVRESVWYDEPWQFHQFCAVFRLLGCKTEGGIGPDPEKKIRGFMMVAVPNEKIKPKALAESLGISQIPPKLPKR